MGHSRWGGRDNRGVGVGMCCLLAAQRTFQMQPGRQEKVSSLLGLPHEAPTLLPIPLPYLLLIYAPDTSSPSEALGPGKQPETRSFWSYALSQRFACHLLWLSVIQLWHYLFIGTLNSLLTSLAKGDREVGMWLGSGGEGRPICAARRGTWNLEVRGTELSGALWSAGRSEQGCGEEGRAGQRQVGQSSPVRQSWKFLTGHPLSALCSQHLHKRLRHHSVLRSAVCPLERAAHGPAQAEVPEGSERHR